jgi:hypothetical protein
VAFGRGRVGGGWGDVDVGWVEEEEGKGAVGGEAPAAMCGWVIVG